MYEGKYLFTGIMEGTAIQTSRSGSKVKFLLAYEDHHFDRDWNIVDTKGWGRDDPRWESQGIRYSGFLDYQMQEAFGLYYIGLPPRKVVESERTWTEWEIQNSQAENKHAKADIELKKRTEVTRRFYAKQFAYAFTMDNVETSIGLKVDVRFTVYVRGTNPYTALIKNDDWFLTLDTILRNRVKNFLGGKSFLDLLTEEGMSLASLKSGTRLEKLMEMLGLKNAPDGTVTVKFGEFIRQMEREVGGVVKSLPDSLGIVIDDAEMQELDLSPDEKVLAALQQIALDNAKTVSDATAAAEALATETAAKKSAIIEISVAESTAIENVGSARAKALEAETRALEGRVALDERYLKAGGAGVIQERVRQEGTVQTAQALAKAPHLTSIVFPQLGPVTPVVPVGK